MTTVYTVGHSNRTLFELVELLRDNGVTTLVDIRQQPSSSRFPQFNEGSLRDALTAVEIQYHWAGRQLGGRREAQADSRHIALPLGLRGFADYMDGPDFGRAAGQLLGLAQRAATAMLCAERDPIQCHRSLIADYLTLQGIEVVHLIDLEQSIMHQLRPEVRRESASLIYDRQVSANLPFDTEVEH